MAFSRAVCLWHFNLSVNGEESLVPPQKWKVPMLPVVKCAKVKIWKTHLQIFSCTFLHFCHPLILKPKVDYLKHTVQPPVRNYLYLDVNSYSILNLVILTIPLNIYWQFSLTSCQGDRENSTSHFLWPLFEYDLCQVFGTINLEFGCFAWIW